MELSIAEAATLLGVSDRAVRGRLTRGTLKGFKRGGRWVIQRRALPLDEPMRRAFRSKADTLRAAVEAALPAAVGGRGGGGRAGLAEMEAFRVGVVILATLDGPAAECLREALMYLSEAHHQFDRPDKHAALVAARAHASRCVATLLLGNSPADVEAIAAIEHALLPRIGGLLRWVSTLDAA